MNVNNSRALEEGYRTETSSHVGVTSECVVSTDCLIFYDLRLSFDTMN